GSEGAGVANLPVDQSPLDTNAAGLAELRREVRRCISLAPVGVRAIPVERDIAIARGARDRPLAQRHEPGALSRALVAEFAGRPAGDAFPAGAGEDLDDAADRVRAVERGKGTARDLDPVDVLRGHAGPVVAREIRRVHTHAVDEDER